MPRSPTRPVSAFSMPPIAYSAAGATAASAWTRSPPRRRHQAHALLPLREQGPTARPVLEAQHQLALDAFRTFGDRLSGSPEAIIDGLFRELAVWADRPRWAGSGFTRLVIELADLPGHPARLIARRHKAMLEAHLAELLARPASNARPRSPARSGCCRRARSPSCWSTAIAAMPPQPRGQRRHFSIARRNALVDVRRCPGSRPSLSLPVPTSRDN